jgi:hypothetical protein
VKREFDQLATVLKNSGLVASYYDAVNMAKSINDGTARDSRDELQSNSDYSFRSVTKSGPGVILPIGAEAREQAYAQPAYQEPQETLQSYQEQYSEPFSQYTDSMGSESMDDVSALQASDDSLYGFAEEAPIIQEVSSNEKVPGESFMEPEKEVEVAENDNLYIEQPDIKVANEAEALKPQARESLSLFDEAEEMTTREKEVENMGENVDMVIEKKSEKSPGEIQQMVRDMTQEAMQQQMAAQQQMVQQMQQQMLQQQQMFMQMMQSMKAPAPQPVQQPVPQQTVQQPVQQQRMVIQPVQQPQPVQQQAPQPDRRGDQQVFGYPQRSNDTSHNRNFIEVPVDHNRPKPALTKEEMASTDITKWFNFSGGRKK